MKIIRERVAIFDTFEEADAERKRMGEAKPHDGRRSIQVRRVGPEGSLFALIVNRQVGGKIPVDPPSEDAPVKKKTTAKERRAAAKKKRK